MTFINTLEELRPLIPDFEGYEAVVIISRYNSGKTSIAAEELLSYYGEDRALYATFIDQSKPGFTPRSSQLEFGESVEDKIIIFDELFDDEKRDVSGYAHRLLKDNQVISLTNPYGKESSGEHEIELFKSREGRILPENTLFIYVRNPRQ